ncbi:MAG: carboxylate--amine ligase [Candidatus Kariarchaeaceae archaeon]|jgi:predicted ATP-grasp superfamily ATP-dependent carboligase
MHEEVFIVSKHLDRLEKTGTCIPVSDFGSLRRLHVKSEVAKLAQKLDIPIPLTLQPCNRQDVKHFAAHAGFPVVIKLPISNSSKGVFYCNTLENLLESYEKTRSSHPILQQYVHAEGYGVCCLFNRGKVRAIFTHKRLREKIFSGGTSSKRISLRNKTLEEYGIRLLEEVKFHGVAMVEFKYDENEDKAWLLEVNPRFWGSLALPIAAGLDFPFLLYKIATEGDVSFTDDYDEGVVVRWIIGDILATFSKIRQTRSLFSPIKDFCTLDETGFDDFFLDDPIPFIMESVYYLLKFLRTRSSNPMEEAILDIETV